MQMTNICRDIFEDAQRQIYLPAEMLPARVNALGWVAATLNSAMTPTAPRCIARHCQYYASARLGYGYLPTAVRQ